jgi:hypothetical protein
VETLLHFLDSHASLRVVTLLNHDVCQRPEFISGWYTRNRVGLPSDDESTDFRPNDVMVCGHASFTQMHLTFKHHVDSTTNSGCFGLVMRQAVLRCFHGFSYASFRSLAEDAVRFSAKVVVFHAMQHRFYAGTRDPLSQERFRHLEYRSALSSQIHALPNDQLRVMILEAVHTTLSAPYLRFSCVDAPFVLHAIRGHIVYWRDPPFNQIEKLWPFNQASAMVRQTMLRNNITN